MSIKTNPIQSKESLGKLEEKVSKNISHLIAAMKDVGESKFYIISKDCDGGEHVNASYRVRDEISLAIENLRNLRKGLVDASICAEARKDCMLDQFRRLQEIKNIADKYPDLPVSEVLSMVTEDRRRRNKEKQDAKQG